MEILVIRMFAFERFSQRQLYEFQQTVIMGSRLVPLRFERDS